MRVYNTFQKLSVTIYLETSGIPNHSEMKLNGLIILLVLTSNILQPIQAAKSPRHHLVGAKNFLSFGQLDSSRTNHHLTRLATAKMNFQMNPIANPKPRNVFPPTEKNDKKHLYLIHSKKKNNKENNPRRKRYLSISFTSA